MGQITVYALADGSPVQVDSVDAREYVESGSYSYQSLEEYEAQVKAKAEAVAAAEAAAGGKKSKQN